MQVGQEKSHGRISIIKFYGEGHHCAHTISSDDPEGVHVNCCAYGIADPENSTELVYVLWQ